MSDKKNWGHTVLGWFVVKPEESRSGLDPALMADIPGAAEPAPPEPLVTKTQDAEPSLPPPVQPVGELPAADGGVVDFVRVFEAFGVDANERELWARASTLVNSLPPGTDPAIKKQIVEASLKAFGISIEKIIESGVEQIQALDGYQRGKASDVEKLHLEAGKRIAGLEDEIRSIRLVMDTASREQESIMSSCNSKKLEVQSVLEFFGREAVEKVVQQSPKLVDPSAPTVQS